MIWSLTWQGEIGVLSTLHVVSRGRKRISSWGKVLTPNSEKPDDRNATLSLMVTEWPCQWRPERLVSIQVWWRLGKLRGPASALPAAHQLYFLLPLLLSLGFIVFFLNRVCSGLWVLHHSFTIQDRHWISMPGSLRHVESTPFPVSLLTAILRIKLCWKKQDNRFMCESIAPENRENAWWVLSKLAKLLYIFFFLKGMNND